MKNLRNALRMVMVVLFSFIVVMLYKLGVSETNFVVIECIKNQTNMTQSLDSRSSIAHAHHVILSAYMRGGSTLTGEIIGGRPGTLYFYEPLWYLHMYQYIHENNVCSVTNDTCRPSQNVLWNVTDILVMTFGCQFEKQMYLLKKSLHGIYGLPREIWREWEKPNKPLALRLKRLTTACQRSKSISSKILRTTLGTMRHLLNMNENIRIIHLWRDPRGILDSRMKTFRKYYQNADMNAQSLCKKMRQDYNDLKFLFSVKYYRQRIMHIRYEDLTKYPQRVMEEMYQFIGYNLTTNEDSRIKGVMTPKKAKNKSPFEIAQKWRKTMKYSKIISVNEYCADIYRHLGYNVFHSEAELRNLSIPLIVSNIDLE